MAAGKPGVIESSVVLGPGSTVDVPVRCVEKGFAGTRSMGSRPTDSRFTDRRAASPARRLARSKAESLRAHGRYALDQGAVWTHVDDELERTQVRSSTHSYTDFLRSARTKGVAAAREMGATSTAAGEWARAHARERERLDGSASHTRRSPGLRGFAARGPLRADDHAWRGCPRRGRSSSSARGASHSSRSMSPHERWGTPLRFRPRKRSARCSSLDGRLAHVGVGHTPETV